MDEQKKKQLIAASAKAFVWLFEMVFVISVYTAMVFAPEKWARLATLLALVIIRMSVFRVATHVDKNADALNTHMKLSDQNFKNVLGLLEKIGLIKRQGNLKAVEDPEGPKGA